MSDQPKKIIETKEFDPGAFDALLKRMSGSAAAGTEAKSFRYRELVLTIPLEGLRPETYDAPIQLTLRELSSDGEKRAYRACGAKSESSDIGTINRPETDELGRGLLLFDAIAREALHAINGRVLVDSYEKDLVWNSMTMQARRAVSQTFFDSGTKDGLEGKISKSMIVR